MQPSDPLAEDGTMNRLPLALVGLALALTALWCAVLGWEALHVIVLVGIIGALSFTAGTPLPRTGSGSEAS
jgi:hypothetical protein